MMNGEHDTIDISKNTDTNTDNEFDIKRSGNFENSKLNMSDSKQSIDQKNENEDNSNNIIVKASNTISTDLNQSSLECDVNDCTKDNASESSKVVSIDIKQDVEIDVTTVDTEELKIEPDEPKNLSSGKRTGKRKIKQRSWVVQEEYHSTPAKKNKGGLRADCPTFCRVGCTKTHHPLLIHARRMKENDSATTMVFLERVSEFYDSEMDSMKPSDVIDDPWKFTSFPLLHYLALMGKCSGCFALVDAGHDPKTVLTHDGENVLHTLVREMYHFNCTHGHMDILLKKFNLLLKDFQSCAFLTNSSGDTPLHICGILTAKTSRQLTVDGRSKPPFRLYQFLKNMLCSFLSILDEKDELLDLQNSEGCTVAHYIADDRGAEEVLTMLKEKGCNFSILNNKNQSVDDIQTLAPIRPPDDVLELARISEKSTKRKSIPPKKDIIKSSPRTPKPSLKIKYTLKQEGNEAKRKKASPSLVKLPFKVKNKTADVKKTIKKEKLPLTSPTFAPDQNSSIKYSNVLKNTNSAIESDPVNVLSTTGAMNNNCTVTKTTKNSSTKKATKNSTKPILPKNDSSDKSVNVSSHITNLSTMSISSIKPVFDSLPKMGTYSKMTDIQPTPSSLSNLSITKTPATPFPVISNVRSFHPPASNSLVIIQPNVYQVPRNPSISPSTSVVNPLYKQTNSVNQPPVFIKTADGRLMSFNVMSSNKANALPQSIGRTCSPGLSGIPSTVPTRLFLTRPNGFDVAQSTRYGFPGVTRHVLQQQNGVSNFSASTQIQRVAPNFTRPMSQFEQLGLINAVNAPPRNIMHQPGVFPSMVIPSPASVIRPPFDPSVMQPLVSAPVMRPNFNASYMGHPVNAFIPQHAFDTRVIQSGTDSMINTMINIQKENVPIQPGLTNLQSVTSVPVGVDINRKNNIIDTHKRNRCLEDSIKNLQKSAIAAQEQKDFISNLITKSNENAPPVIILDNDEAMDDNELCKVSVKTPDEKKTAGSNHHHMQEKVSVSDFLQFSQDKKNKLLVDLYSGRKMVEELNTELHDREKEVKETRQLVVKREMEIAHLRLKLTNLQHSMKILRTKRSTAIASCVTLEKKAKEVDDRTEIFQTLAVKSDIKTQDISVQ